MIELLQYWFLSGLLLAAVGWCAEAVLKQRGREARWIWVTTSALTLASPLLPKLWTTGAEAIPDGAGLGALPGVEILESVPAAAQGIGTTTTIMLAWVLLSVVLLAVGVYALARLRRDARRWRSATLLGQDVLLSSDFGPAVMGVRQPRIVVPEHLPECSEAELEMMLQHEREHIRSRDPLLLRIAYIMGALMPWNLALLWQVGRLRQRVEQDCDLRVIAGGAPPREYGSLLVKMASRAKPGRPWMAAAALAEERSGVARRLRLLSDRSGQARTTVTALLIIAGATSLAVWMGVPSPLHIWAGHSEREHVFFEGDDLEWSTEAAVDPDFDFDFDFEFGEGPKLAPGAAPRVRMRFSDGKWHDVLDGSRGGIEIKVNPEELERARLQEELWQQERLLEEAAVRARGEGGSASEDGQPKRIRISGDGTGSGSNADADAEPLVFVDGVRMGMGKEAIADIDPDDIDRVEVIKGAAAAAIYGDEGSNGVIQIFMKSGKRGPGGG